MEPFLAEIMSLPFMLFGFALYWVPTFIACLRKHPRSGSIALLNFFLGWTLLGWLGALIWSLAGIRRA